MNIVKNSKQRTAIYNFLLSRKDHPTAELIYTHVKREFPNISLATVYRNLTYLVNNDMAIKVPCDDGSEHFDANMMPHYHFQCTECGAVIDLNFNCIDAQKNLNQAASANFSGIIYGSKSFFYGLCSDCIKNKNLKQ